MRERKPQILAQQSAQRMKTLCLNKTANMTLWGREENKLSSTRQSKKLNPPHIQDCEPCLGLHLSSAAKHSCKPLSFSLTNQVAKPFSSLKPCNSAPAWRAAGEMSNEQVSNFLLLSRAFKRQTQLCANQCSEAAD